MVRTIVGIVVLIGVVVWLPVWIQLIFFVAAIIVLPYRYMVLIPAIVGDALYAPNGRFFVLGNHVLTIIVVVLLIVYWYIMKKMRIQGVYGLEA